MKKKFIACMAALSMLAGTTAAMAFDDVYDGDWYSESVNFMVNNGYMNGISDTEFSPNASMTRGMFVTVLGRMDGADVSGYTKKIFPDVGQDIWYSPYVNWGLEQGIVSGFSDLTFHPDEEISRAQLAVMIKRYVDYKNITLNTNPAAYDSYADEASIPQWAAEGAAFMRTTGIITGDSYGSFMPDAVATRAQIAAIIMRLSKAINGETLDIPNRLVHTAAENALNSMTLEQKVYQMIAVTPEQLTGASSATMGGTMTKEAIEKYPVGTLIYSADNVIDAAQITEMLSNTSSFIDVSPFMAVSEELGSNAKISQKLGNDTFKDAYDYRNSSASEVGEAYLNISTNLSSLGFNLDLAPVADLWINPSNTFIAKRAFGNTYEECAQRTVYSISGIRKGGMLSGMKYFPGYGSSAKDPSLTACTSDRTLDDLKNFEFNSYKDGIDAGADVVVCANMWMKNIDAEYPASLSSVFINDLLRNELGFTGIVMTDDLRMKSMSQKYTSAAVAVRAIGAGCDIIQTPENFVEAANAVIQAVKKGEISEDRINDSVLKILNKKSEIGILK